jgi:hypothetical protein
MRPGPGHGWPLARHDEAKLISKTLLACNLSRSKTQRQSRRFKWGLNQSAWLQISDWPLNQVLMSLEHPKICQVFTRRHTLQSTKISIAHLCCRVVHIKSTKTFLKFLQLLFVGFASFNDSIVACSYYVLLNHFLLTKYHAMQVIT